MEIKNLTPHSITLETQIDPGDGGELGVVAVNIHPSGAVARVEQVDNGLMKESIDTATTVSIATIAMGKPIGLPAPEAGVLLIVSREVARCVPERHDVLFPDDLVRDSEGRIIGAKRLARFTEACSHIWNDEGGHFLCLRCGEENWSGVQPA